MNMKKIVIISFLTIAALISINLLFKMEATGLRNSKPINEQAIKKPDRILEGKTIVLDPGHGGKDVGATGQSGLLEKEITLRTAQNIQRLLLERTGATVILSRDNDESLTLSERMKITKEYSADLFISLHFDAFESNKVSGITTYFNKKEDQQLAELVHRQLFKESMGARDRGVSFGDYHVLRENSSPSILLELGFISNKEDEQRIQSSEFQAKSASMIVEGIIKYLSN